MDVGRYGFNLLEVFYNYYILLVILFKSLKFKVLSRFFILSH